MWFLQFLLAGETSGATVASDTWVRCAQARALSAAARGGRTDRGPKDVDDGRLEGLRRLGWSTVAAPLLADRDQT